MKKYYLLSAVLIVVFSANTFANTAISGGTPAKDTSTKANAELKTTASIIISFKGTINSTNNKLHWITEDEHGMKSFTIERSENNRDFYPIAIMPAMNEKGQLFYEYPDKSVASSSSKTFSYRLKVTDANNKDNYSRVIKLEPDNATVAIR